MKLRSRRILLWMLVATLPSALAFSSGCVRQRTVLVPPGEPVQLAEPVEAYIYVTVDEVRVRSPTRVTLPEGWWVLPDPGE